jgi:transposase
VLVAVLQLLLVMRTNGRRPSVPIRADLVRWLRDRAAAEGEPAELIADRAVSAYRADLLGADRRDQRASESHDRR